MRGRYIEFLGKNWTHEFEIEASECVVSLDGETSEEVVDDAERKLLDTSNNAQITIEGCLIRSSQSGFGYQIDNGIAFEQCDREQVVKTLANHV